MPRTYTPKAKTGLRLTPGVPGKKGPSLVDMDPAQTAPPAPGGSLPFPTSAHEKRRVAVAGMVSPRSVAHAYAGKPIRSMCLDRIARAARELGFARPPDAAPSTSSTSRRSPASVPAPPGASMGVVDLGSEPPSRSAKLKTRAAWGATMVQRLRDGQRCTKRDLDLALKWVKEAVEALP